MIACSISAPEYPFDRERKSSSIFISQRYFFNKTWNIIRRFSKEGRSMKKISSHRPLRSISGGNELRLLDVATTKTEAPLSCRKFRKVPKILFETPPSVWESVGENPFSISSIQKMQGDTEEAMARESRKF